MFWRFDSVIFRKAIFGSQFVKFTVEYIDSNDFLIDSKLRFCRKVQISQRSMGFS